MRNRTDSSRRRTGGRVPAAPWRIAGLTLCLALGLTGSPAAAQDPAPEAAPAAPALPADSNATLDFNPFGILQDKPAPPPPTPVAAPPPPPTAPTPTPEVKLPFKLVGTLAGGPQVALAFLEKGGKQEPVRVGATWEQATVLAVQRNRATLRWQNKTTTLEVDFKDWGSSSPPAAGGGSAPAAPDANPAAVYTQPNEVPVPESIETRKVPRAQVDKNLQDLASLLASMRIQPYYDGGQPAGFLLTNVRAGSFIDQVGVQNGDILRFVNGQKIDNVQNAFQLYNIFKNSTNVEVTVVRDTRPVTLKYVIE